MTFKQWVNAVLGKTGYQIRRRPSLARDVDRGKYRWLQSRGIKTVLDVGANVGQFAIMARRIFPEAMIYSFEPLESCFAELRAVAATLRPMECFHCALGKNNSTITMHRNDFTPGSSILPIAARTVDAFPYTSHVVEEQITVRSLDKLAGELSLKGRILLKVDVQGFEMNVLLGGKRTLSKIDVIIIETSFVELYKGQPLFHEVHEFLRKQGFSYSGNFDQLLDPATGAVLQSDAIFLNTRKQA